MFPSLGLGALFSLPFSIGAWVTGSLGRKQVAKGLTKAGDGIAHAGLVLGIVGVVARCDRRGGVEHPAGQRVRSRGVPEGARAGPLTCAATSPRSQGSLANDAEPFTKQYLMTAGPTPVPPAVSQAMAAPMLYHRAPAFDELYERVLGRLPSVFRTSNDVLAFASSG